MIPRNKNISVLHPYMNKKGWAIKMMIYLSNLLVLEWNNVNFYTFSYDKKMFSDFDIKFNIIIWNKLSIANKIKNSDYIIIWNSPMQFVWGISKIFFRSRAKLIWRHHHYPWYYSNNTNFFILIKRFLEKFFLKFIDELIVNSKFLENSLFNLYSRKSKVLYPIVEDIFIQNYSVRNNFTNKVIFSYWRWVKGKNLNQLFDTYLSLKDKIPNLSLLIWWIWEEIEEYQKKFKTDKNISFLWLLDDKSIISNLKKTSIFLFPSKIDSFWMAVLEAQTIGIPVIAFDFFWVREIVINWETWFLVKDETDFTEKTLTLLTNNDLLKNFSENSKKISISFDENNFKKQLNDIF